MSTDETQQPTPAPSDELADLPAIDPLDEINPDALTATQALLHKLNEVRIGFDLPVESLAVIYDMYRSVDREMRDQLIHVRMLKAQADRTVRLPMKIRSADVIGPGVTTPVTTRPSTFAYRVDGIEIEGDPSHWRVSAIFVGNRPQSVGGNEWPYSGTLFRKGGPMGELKLETIQTAMDFTLFVEYVGPDESGAIFEATAFGLAAT